MAANLSALRAKVGIGAQWQKAETSSPLATRPPLRANQMNWQGVAKSSRKTGCFSLVANCLARWVDILRRTNLKTHPRQMLDRTAVRVHGQGQAEGDEVDGLG